MSEVVVRPATAAEFSTAIDWAAAEGWNPGLDDLPAFHHPDPDGFLMGFVDGEPVSSVSVVRYGSDFGFLGFYIVRADMRGQGAGIATWNAGMAHLEGRTIGLDGVVAQQDNYRKSGFVFAGRNIRHTGVPNVAGPSAASHGIRPVVEADFAALCAYDAQLFPADRALFLREWTTPAEDIRRTTLISIRDGDIAGYGTIRACGSGYKIGPLFADDASTAEALFTSLCGLMPAGHPVSLDTPQDNAVAVAMARRAGLEPVFETARMYRGRDPGLPLERIFGITTFELG